jgi:hypothetical protein
MEYDRRQSIIVTIIIVTNISVYYKKHKLSKHIFFTTAVYKIILSNYIIIDNCGVQRI